jgi:hypothetical protein
MLWLKQLGVNIGVYVVTETVRSEHWSICRDWKNLDWILVYMLRLKQLGVNIGVYVVTETMRCEHWSICCDWNNEVWTLECMLWLKKFGLEYMLWLKQLGLDIGVYTCISWLKQLGLDIGIYVATETVRSECSSICCDWISNFNLKIKYFSYYRMYLKYNCFLYAHHFYLSCMSACQGHSELYLWSEFFK